MSLLSFLTVNSRFYVRKIDLYDLQTYHASVPVQDTSREHANVPVEATTWRGLRADPHSHRFSASGAASALSAGFSALPSHGLALVTLEITPYLTDFDVA